VTAPLAGLVDHTIDAGVYSPAMTPPSSPPPSKPSSGSSHSPQTVTSPSSVQLAAGIDTGRPGVSGGDPWLVLGGISALVAAGLMIAMALRRCRTRTASE
jgi:hypothetical protein